MKYLKIVLIIFVFGSLNAQLPYFFKTVDWGEGGCPYLRYKWSHVQRINVVEDGYIYSFSENSDIPIHSIYRIAKLSFDLEPIWSIDFISIDTLVGLDNRSWNNEIIRNGNLLTILESKINGIWGNIIVSVNIEDGQLEYIKKIPSNKLDLTGGYYNYQDSLIVVGGVDKNTFGGGNITIIRKDGSVVKEINIEALDKMDYLGGIHARDDSLYNMTYFEFTNNNYTTSYKLHAGVIDINGNIINDVDLGNHVLLKTEFPAINESFSGHEVTLNNGNRVMTAVVDTADQLDPLDISVLTKIFKLDTYGNIISDTLLNLSPNTPPDVIHPLQDTMYSPNDIMKSKSGEVYIVGRMITAWYPWSTHEETITNKGEMFLMKLDQEGDMLWRKHFAPFSIPIHDLNNIKAYQIKEDIDGGLLIVGTIDEADTTIVIDEYNPWQFKRYGFILKLDTDGCYKGDCNGGDILLETNNIEPQNSPFSFSIFPNPAKDFINIEVDLVTPYSIRVLSVDGSVVYEQREIVLNQKSIDIRSFRSGLYFVQIEHNKKSMVNTFVVE